MLKKGGNPDSAELRSWKAIASYLGRDESTVKRWEETRGLPVRRLPGSGRAAVFAYTHELKAWQDRASEDVPATDLAAVSATRRFRTYGLIAVAAVVLLAVAVRITLNTGPQSTTNLAPRTHDPAAAESYLSGLHEWQTRTPSGLSRAVADFSDAIRRDPKFAQAYVGLANTYDLMREFTLMPSNVAYSRAAAAATRAIALDPSLAEAHSALAFSDFYWRRDVAGAQREFVRALELDPGSAPAHHWYATYLMTMGNFGAARGEIERASRLDPESTAIIADKALIEFYGGDAQRAVALLKQIETDQPLFASPHLYLSAIAMLEGRDRDYLREMNLLAVALHDGDTVALSEAGGRGLAAGGHVGMLRAILAQRLVLYAQGRGTAYDVAQDFALLGNSASALDYLSLSLARQEPEIVGMKINPALSTLRDTATYRKRLHAAGL